MGVHKITETYGDNLLSTFERRLWDLTYYCLVKYYCPVMFNVYGPNAPLRIDQKITFFVPTDNDKCEEVKKFLVEELTDENREGQTHEHGGPCGDEHQEYWPGCSVEVLEYSGPNFYLENLYSKPILAKAAQKFMEALEQIAKTKTVH